MSPIIFDAAAISAIIGYTSLAMKYVPAKFRKYGVFISCVIGALYALTVRPVTKQDILKTIMEGTMLGLSASGGYAGMKSAASG